MPLWGTWFDNGTTATTATSSPWVTIDIGTNSTSAATYTGQTITVGTRTGTNTVWWSTNTSDQGAWVDQETYIRLAQQRVIVSREQRAEMLRLQAEQQRLWAERYEQAKARSKELLLAHLTPAQRDTFEKNSWFVVEGGRSKQLYRIRNSGSYSGNIDVLEGRPGKVTHRLCCHLRDCSIPLFDHLLAQKVWIERDEDQFLRTANRHAA